MNRLPLFSMALIHRIFPEGNLCLCFPIRGIPSSSSISCMTGIMLVMTWCLSWKGADQSLVRLEPASKDWLTAAIWHCTVWQITIAIFLVVCVCSRPWMRGRRNTNLCIEPVMNWIYVLFVPYSSIWNLWMLRLELWRLFFPEALNK